MNTFALEIFDDQGQVCTFYTVRWEDATLSETDKFFQKFRYDEQLKNSLQELASFLQVVIGDEYGALEYFFRFENAAQALPPSGTYKVQDVFNLLWQFPPPIVLLADFRKLGGIVQWCRKNSCYSTRRKNKYGISGSQYFRQTYVRRITTKRNLHYY